jgi:beta-lactam-binding protein with PASTA domain
MPNLVDASVRQALAMIESYGLKAGRKDFRPDPCVNCVLAQMLKGKKVEPGEMIPKGSVIDLVLGKGQDGELLNVPCVIGLTRQEALNKIAENGMSEGAVACSDCKTAKEKETAKVYRQTPGCAADNLARPGTVIDLYLTTKTIATGADTTNEDDE